jgi:ActR/RegA family two-component response regulator
MGDETVNHKYSVLVIDDQDNWRNLLTEILEDQFDVKNASNYSEALSAIRDQNPPFHVVVTDMRLVDEEVGNEDGLRLIDYLNERGDETKTIVITGYATVASAIKAMDDLSVYKYLEKKPSKAESFDYQKFHQIVYKAAEDAEKERPEGFTDIVQHILLIESDPVWSLKLEGILKKGGYQVDVISDIKSLAINIKNSTREYVLTLVNESLANKDLLDALCNSQPDSKIILLTSRDVDNIFDAMKEYQVLTAITLKNEHFDSQKFGDFIHSILAYGSMKYVLVSINPNNQSGRFYPADLKVGVSCKVTLSIQNEPTAGALRVFLFSKEEKKRKLQLHLFIHAEQIRFEPSTEIYWEIPLSVERPPLCEIAMTPLSPGKNTITIEIDQNHRPLGRILLPINII